MTDVHICLTAPVEFSDALRLDSVQLGLGSALALLCTGDLAKEVRLSVRFGEDWALYSVQPALTQEIPADLFSGVCIGAVTASYLLLDESLQATKITNFKEQAHA